MPKVTPTSLEQTIDVLEENNISLKESLLKISQKEKAVVLAFIAPYVGKKVSPTRVLTAELGILEEFAIETSIEKIREQTSCDRLILLLNSPGGFVSSSYKVAKALRSNYKEIKVFVPHIAASGGTLIALTGNQIVMGMMSHLSPIDPHGMRGNQEVAAKNVIDGFETITEFFRNISEEDAPYTYKVLAQKYNAEELDEAIASITLMEDYAGEILIASGYTKEKATEIAEQLVLGYRTHGEVINFDKAKNAGLNVISNTCCVEDWSILRKWLGQYLLQSADKHIIRFVISQDLIDAKQETKVEKPESEAKELKVAEADKKQNG